MRIIYEVWMVLAPILIALAIIAILLYGLYVLAVTMGTSPTP